MYDDTTTPWGGPWKNLKKCLDQLFPEFHGVGETGRRHELRARAQKAKCAHDVIEQQWLLAPSQLLR